MPEVQAVLVESELATAPGVIVMVHAAPTLSVPLQVLLDMLVPEGRLDVLTVTLVALCDPVFRIVICRGLPVSTAFVMVQEEDGGQLTESPKVETLGVSMAVLGVGCCTK